MLMIIYLGRVLLLGSSSLPALHFPLGETQLDQPFSIGKMVRSLFDLAPGGVYLFSL
jgi:hypothetical protein